MENLPFSMKCNVANLSQLGVHYTTIRATTGGVPFQMGASIELLVRLSGGGLVVFPPLFVHTTPSFAQNRPTRRLLCTDYARPVSNESSLALSHGHQRACSGQHDSGKERVGRQAERANTAQ